MATIYTNTRYKLLVLFLLISSFGFTQGSYELKVKSRVVQDSLLIDLEVENTGALPFNFGIGQFVFGFVDTAGINFSAGKIKAFNKAIPLDDNCYNTPSFSKITSGKYVNFQVNKLFSAPAVCANSSLINSGKTIRLATLYFPIRDCTKDIELVTPTGAGDARVNWTGQDLENDLGFNYSVVYMPSSRSLTSNSGYTFGISESKICGSDTISLWVEGANKASLAYSFIKEDATGSKALLVTNFGTDTLYKSVNQVLNGDQIFVEVDDASSCVFTSNKVTMSVTTPVTANFSYKDTCVGLNTIFTNTSVAVPTATNQWVFGDGTPLATTKDVSHLYAQKGSYDVGLKVINGECRDSITRKITIAGTNKPNLGADTSSCDGSAINIQPKETNGYTFEWKEISQASFGTGGNSFTVSSAGKYIVKADSLGSNCVSFDTIEVSHSTFSSINYPKDTSACDGTQLVFNLIVPGTANVEWRDNNSNTLFENKSTFTFAGSNGSASIKVKVIDGSCADSSDFEITKVSGITISSDPVVGQLDPSTLEFKWKKVPGVSEYKVSYNLNGASTVSSASVGLDTTYTISGLASGGNIDTVVFTVEALGTCGSDLSTPVKAVIGNCEVMPLITEIDTARVTAVSSSSLSFIWNGVSGAVGYEVQYTVNGGSPTAFQAIGADTAYTITGLSDLDKVSFTYKAFTNCASRLKTSKAIAFDCNTNWTGVDESKTYCTSSFNIIANPVKNSPGLFLIGEGTYNTNDTLFYINPQDAGAGTHTISLVGCYNNDTTSKILTIAAAPCSEVVDGTGTGITFKSTRGVYTDCSGQIYFTNSDDNTIIKIDSFGTPSVIAGLSSSSGYVDGHVSVAEIGVPLGLLIDDRSGILYFTDNKSGAVRTYNPMTEQVSTLVAGGVFDQPFGLTRKGDTLYVGVTVSPQILGVSLIDSSVWVAAGTGASGFANGNAKTQAQFTTDISHISYINGRVYIADKILNQIRYYDPALNQVGVVTGTGGSGYSDAEINSAVLSNPIGVAGDGQGNVYFVEEGNCSLRKISDDTVSTIIGYPGKPTFIQCNNTDSTLAKPSGLSVFVNGFIDVVELGTGNGQVRRIAIEDYLNGPFKALDTNYCVGEDQDTLNPITVAGNYSVTPNTPGVLTISGGYWIFNPSDTGKYEICFNHSLGDCVGSECFKLNVTAFPTVNLGSDTLMCPSQAGNYRIQTKGDTTYSFQWSENTITQSDFSERTDDTLYYTNITEYGEYVLSSSTKFGCKSNDTLLVSPSPDLQVQIGSDKGNISCAEDVATLLSVKISNTPGIASYLWNTGDITASIQVNKAGFYKVSVKDSIGCIGDTSFIFNIHPTPTAIISTPNKVNDAVVSTLLQNKDSLISPYGMVEDNQGNMFITDNVKQVIFKYNKPSKKLSVFAGELNQAGFRNGAGTGAWFNQPKGITIDSVNNIYVADELNNVIRKITPTGIVTTHVGQFYTTGITHRDTLNTYARFNKPTGVTLDGTGNFVIADRGNNVIRTYNVANDKVGTIGVPSSTGASVDDTFSLAKFNNPSSVFFHPTGKVFVGENNKIRLVNVLTRKVTTVDDGSVADPISFSGNVLGASSYGGTNVISVVENLNQVFYSSLTGVNNLGTSTGLGTYTLVGQSSAGYVDSNRVHSQFNGLQGVYIGSGLYVSDKNNNAIRQIKDSNYVFLCPGDSLALTANAGGSYNWKFNNVSIGNTQTVTIGKVGLYTLEYTDLNTGCLGFDSIYVNTFASPVLTSVTTDTTLCKVDTVDLFARTLVPTDSIFWYKNSVTSPFVSSGIHRDSILNISFDLADTYYVVASNGVCTDTAKVVVSPTDLNLSIVTIKDTLCFGDTTMLIAKATSTLGIKSYLWDITKGSGMAVPNSLDDDSLTISPLGLGDNKYLVTVVDSNLCKAIDSVNVFLLDSLSITFSEDTIYQCTRESAQTITATVSGGKLGYDYNWIAPSVAGLTINPANQDVVITYTGDTTLTAYIKLRITDANKCVKDDSIRVELTSFEIKAIAQFDTVCPNTNNLLNLTIIEGGVGPFSYAWSPNVMLDDSTLKSPTSVLANDLTYTVLVTDATSKCKAIDSIKIKVLDLSAVVGTKGVDTAYVCENDTYVLDASNSSGGSKPYSFAWTKISGDDIGATSPTVDTDDSLSVSNGTVGTISLYKVNVRDGVGCVDSDTIALRWNNKVLAGVSLDSLVGCINTTDSLSANNISGGISPYTYLWNVNGTALISCATCDTTVVTITNRDTSNVTLTVTDSVGCTAIDSVAVRGYELIVDATAKLGQVCTGVTDTLGVDITQDGLGKVGVVWSPTSYLSNHLIENPVVTITSDQRFKVEVIDSLTGCRAKDSIDIKIQNIIAVIDHPSVVKDTLVVCFDTPSIALNASKSSGGSPRSSAPFYVYNWSSATTVNFTNNTLDTVQLNSSVQDTTKVIVRVEDKAGCRAEDSIVVIWNDKLDATITGPSYLCEGDTSKAIVKIQGGVQSVQNIEWKELNKVDDVIVALTALTDSVGIISKGTIGKDTILAIVTDKVGCKVTDSLFVTLSQLTAKVTLNEDTVCSGGSVIAKAEVLNGNGPYSYNWENSIATSVDSLVKTIVSTELIEVVITDSTTLCQTTENVRVVVNEIIVALKTNDNVLHHCFEDSVTTIELTPLKGGSNSFVNPKWTNNGTSVQTTEANLDFTIDDNSLSDSNVVVFYVEDTKGCSGSDTITLFRNTKINVATGRAIDVCLGDSVLLNAPTSTGGTATTYTYNWTAANGKFRDASNLVTSYQSSIAGNKVLRLTAVDNGYPIKCSNFDEVSVEVKALPSVAIKDSTYCNNSSFVLDLSDNGIIHSGSEVVTWKLNGTAISSVGDRVTLTDQIGNLKLIVTDNGCTDSNIVTIDTISLPIGSMIVPNNICDSDSIRLVGSFTNAISSFSWVENGNGIILKDSLVTHYLPRLDTGYVTFVLEGINVCGTSKITDSTLVHLLPNPKLNVGDTTILKGSIISYLSLTEGNNLKYNWEFEKGDRVILDTIKGTIDISYELGGTVTTNYKVTDTITRCNSELTIRVTVFDQVVYYIPNVFSPEASNSENKTFKIYGENIAEEDFGITIFNRWGQEVFSSTSLKEMQQTGWDGTDVLSGAYTYTLKMKLSDGEVIEKVGNVTLIK